MKRQLDKIHTVLLKVLIFTLSNVLWLNAMYAQCITYTVKACIDGQDELHIQNNQMWWNHITFTPPGQHTDCAGVLSVNNVNWNPWNTPFNLPTSVQCYSLSSVNVISCRSNCALIQAPSAANGWETIYSLDDNAPGGAAVYEIVFTFCPAFTVNVTATQVSCNGGNNGSATVTANGSSGYTYTWSPVGGNGTTANSLMAGTYTVAVKDLNNCVFSKTINVNQPPPLSITSVQTKSVTCYGGSDGSATVTANGGTSPYSYTWMPSGGNSNVATNLSYGQYTVLVNDANNCGPVQATANINQPPDITVSITPTNVACYGGTDGAATGYASGGGSGFFNWVWTNGTSTIGVNPYIGNLPAGNYTLIVTDLNGCVKTMSVDIGEPPPINILILGTQSVSCFGGNDGSISVLGVGGVGGFSYQWTPGGFTTATISNLQANTYTVFVTDTNSCVKDTSITIIQPPALSITAVEQQSVSCYGTYNGIASCNITGGMPNYNYTWYDASGNIVSITYTASNLGAGNYTVIGTDANGCTTQTAVTISQPPPLNFTVTQQVNNVGCSGIPQNTVYINATGGVGNYTYTSIPAGITASVNTNVPQGTYTIITGDANGCSTYTIFNVILPPVFSMTATQIQSVTCNGLFNGSASVSVVGGGGSYTFT